MKQIGAVGTAMLSIFLLGVAAFGFAQQEDKHQEQKKGQKQTEPPTTRGKPAAYAVHVQQQRTPEERGAQEVQSRAVWAQHRATSFNSEHQSWTQRGGYHGYRIPDASFGRSFGRNHSFHVFDQPFMEVGGYPRFQYEGYWFSVIDPYPEYWGTDWFDTDDVYVDYADGGYYLYDRSYPGRPGLAISISM